MSEAEFTLPAVHCDGCFTGIEMASRIQKGVTGVKGAAGTKNVTVTWNEAETDRNAVADWLTGLGYEPTPQRP